MKRLIFLSMVVVTLALARSHAAVQSWVQRYAGAAGSNDLAVAMVVDTEGNIFVTGSSISDLAAPFSYEYVTIKYSSNGTPVWTNRSGWSGATSDKASAMALDNLGNVFVAGASGGNYLTIKYANGGAPLWTNRYAGPIGQDLPNAIAVDRNGNVFVTGSSKGTDGYPDYATVAYSSDGIPLWENRFADPAGNFDEARAIAVDTNGDVFVTGYSARIPSFYDYATIKYSGSGQPLWTNYYGRTGSGSPADDQANAIVVDVNGDVIVTGTSTGGTSGRDYVTIKYANAGLPLWTNRYGESPTSSDSAVAVAADGIGDIYVTGYSYLVTSGFDFATIKYSSSGLSMWTNRFSYSTNSQEFPGAIAVDCRGGVVVTGSSTNAGGSLGYVTVGYSSAGVPQWTENYVGAGSRSDKPTAIAVDCEGHVFVTGYSTGAGNDYDFATVKYSIIEPALLELQTAGNLIVLCWTNAAFTLQSAPAGTGTFTNIPGATSPYTNPITTAQQFFRLISN